MAMAEIERMEDIKIKRNEDLLKGLNRHRKRNEKNPKYNYPIHTDTSNLTLRQKASSNNQDPLLSQSTSSVIIKQELEAGKVRLEQLKKDLEEKESRLRAKEESLIQKENELNNKPKTKSLFRRIFRR